MAAVRAARAALALAVAVAAGPAAAQVGTRAVAIYPFSRSEGTAAEDAQGLLESALQRAANRTDVVLSEPLVVRSSCGPAQTAPLPCLARLAGSGILLRAVLHKSERSAAIAVEAVDGATGRSVGPVTVGIDLFIQNAEPLARALVMLFEDVRAAARRQAGGMPRPVLIAPPLVPVTPPAKAEAPKPPPPDLRAAEPAPAKASPAAEASVSRSAPPRSTLRTMAPYVAGTGLTLLAGAAVVAMKNQELSDELDRKYQEGTLTPEDAASYKKVDQYNTITIVLAATGGALTLTSAYMFTVLPSRDGASVAMVGRF